MCVAFVFAHVLCASIVCVCVCTFVCVQSQYVCTDVCMYVQNCIYMYMFMQSVYSAVLSEAIIIFTLPPRSLWVGEPCSSLVKGVWSR